MELVQHIKALPKEKQKSDLTVSCYCMHQMYVPKVICLQQSLIPHVGGPEGATVI